MRDLAPSILRQRLLIEAKYDRVVTQADVEDFLRRLPEALSLRIYSDPVVYSPAGDGKQENQGYDGFVALIDSGIAIYVWENQKFVSVVIYTCKAFDVDTALSVTQDYFNCIDLESMPF